MKPRWFFAPYNTIWKVSWLWLKCLNWFNGAWHIFKREVGVAPTLLFPIKGQKRCRRARISIPEVSVQLVQFHTVNLEAAPLTLLGVCPSPGGRPDQGKLLLAVVNKTTVWLSIPSAGSRAGVGHLLFSSTWGIVMDIPGPTSLLGDVCWLVRCCKLSLLPAKENKPGSCEDTVACNASKVLCKALVTADSKRLDSYPQLS